MSGWNLLKMFGKPLLTPGWCLEAVAAVRRIRLCQICSKSHFPGRFVLPEAPGMHQEVAAGHETPLNPRLVPGVVNRERCKDKV